MMGPWAWIWMVIWIVALLFAVWLIVRVPASRPPNEEAMAILRARFARGEITQDEFERARNALLSDRRQTTQ